MYNKQIKINIKSSETFVYTEFNYCLSFLIGLIQTKFVSVFF